MTSIRSPARCPALFSQLFSGVFLALLLSLTACSSSGPPRPKEPPNPRAAQPPPAPQKPPAPRAPKPLPRVVENSLGMKFVQVPAGRFVMGSAETPAALARSYPQYDAPRLADLADEAPPHPVHISHSFFLASMRSPSGSSAGS